MMFFPLIAFATIVILFTLDVFSPPQKPKKTPEEELNDAVKKYMAAKENKAK